MVKAEEHDSTGLLMSSTISQAYPQLWAKKPLLLKVHGKINRSSMRIDFVRQNHTAEMTRPSAVLLCTTAKSPIYSSLAWPHFSGEELVSYAAVDSAARFASFSFSVACQKPLTPLLSQIASPFWRSDALITCSTQQWSSNANRRVTPALPPLDKGGVIQPFR